MDKITDEQLYEAIVWGRQDTRGKILCNEIEELLQILIIFHDRVLSNPYPMNSDLCNIFDKVSDLIYAKEEIYNGEANHFFEKANYLEEKDEFANIDLLLEEIAEKG